MHMGFPIGRYCGLRTDTTPLPWGVLSLIASKFWSDHRSKRTNSAGTARRRWLEFLNWLECEFHGELDQPGSSRADDFSKMGLVSSPSTAAAPQNWAWLNVLNASIRNSNDLDSVTRSILVSVVSSVSRIR
jgi:hypothetical protein